MHEKTHLGIRDFACRFCPKKFIKKYHLQRHEQTQHKLTPTGLEAAGEHLNLLKNAVTVVF